MDRDPLTQYIVDRLSAAANRDDIVRYVCQRAKLSWPEGEALVAGVEDRFARKIERRHLPVNLTSAFMVCLFGGLLTAYALLSIFEPLLGRILPNPFYVLTDLGVRQGWLPDMQYALENLHRYGILPDFWRRLYTVGQTYGVSRDLINAFFILASGYLFWPFLLVGLGSLIAGSTEFFRNLFRLFRR
jgi:hypothetical protein